jgi:hypothetical protein
VATLWTGWRMLPYMLRLKSSSLQCFQAPPPLHTVPVRYAPQAFPRYPTLQPTREMVERERTAA